VNEKQLALLERVRELGARESGLAVVVTFRADGSAPASVVNAGVLDHPVTGERIVGFVARGHAKKLEHLRARPRATVIFRSGWDWVAVEGDAQLVGPNDALDGITAEALPPLIRSIYAAAVGGTPDDWADLDASIADEGHTAVLITPTRTYTNPD
jgi:PPOX class probable F420-dependent enzyme